MKTIVPNIYRNKNNDSELDRKFLYALASPYISLVHCLRLFFASQSQDQCIVMKQTQQQIDKKKMKKKTIHNTVFYNFVQVFCFIFRQTIVTRPLNFAAFIEDVSFPARSGTSAQSS